ncbi:MAG: phage tail protein [Gammaproteobacteria bacterium]
MSEPFIGEIAIKPYTFAPRGWTWCEGQQLSIAQNTSLFAVIGTIYGGDGRVSFAVPHLQGRSPMGVGTGPGLSSRNNGDLVGNDLVSLVSSELPPHTHTVSMEKDAADNNSPNTAALAFLNQGGAKFIFKNNATNLDTNLAADAIGTTGDSVGHENRQPYLGIRFCMALDGVFPSRN